jgi:2,3-bisphosphoglycerate-independent phosphoglycerate mutase
VLLLVLDGWGYRQDSANNALALANLPNWRKLLADYPHTLVETHGLHVGLPDGQMGNSEVGHMNIGAGRIVYQDLTRIDAAIADGSFVHNAALLQACAAAKATCGTLHIFGLLSPVACTVTSSRSSRCSTWRRSRASRIAVHAFLDGRDTPPQSARASLERLEARCAKLPNAFVATISGRYYAMDRDKRWDRVQLAYDAITDAQSMFHAESALGALDASYARGETDEFVKPTVIGAGAKLTDGDAVVYMNFRADRARQLTQAFVDPKFDAFARPRAAFCRRS